MSVSWFRLDALLKLSAVLSITTVTLVSGQAYARTPQISFAGLTGRASQTLPTPVGFSVKASAGYSLFVFGVKSRRGQGARVMLVVTGKHDSAFYSVPAHVNDTSMEADLGALGKIAVAFHPSGEARTVHSSCDQRTVSFDSGFYEGTIEFHGEDGYTDLEATSAEGDVGFLLEILCPGMSGTTGASSALSGAELDAESGGPRQGFGLKIVKNRPRARTHVEVGVTETHKEIVVSRFVNLVAAAGTFRYDPFVRSAFVQFPDPFSGSAQYHRGAMPRNIWTGNLAVDFPGRKDVKLTGSDVRVRLRHAIWN